MDRRVKEKQPKVFSICGNSFETVGKAFQVKLVERVCKAVIKAKGGYFGYYMIPYVLFHSLMSSLLFYNEENSQNKEQPLNE
jgi:hypothetical protein